MSKSTTTAIEIIQHIQGIVIPGSTDRFLQKADGKFGLLGSRDLHFLQTLNQFTSLSIRVHTRSADGYGPDQKVSSLYVEVDSHKRGRNRYSFSSVKIDLTREDWPEKLSNAIVSGYFVLKTRHENNVAASKARYEAQLSAQDYAKSLSTLLGEKVYDFRLVRGADGFPTGLRLEITVGGTPEKVAEKIRQIKAITA